MRGGGGEERGGGRDKRREGGREGQEERGEDKEREREVNHWQQKRGTTKAMLSHCTYGIGVSMFGSHHERGLPLAIRHIGSC